MSDNQPPVFLPDRPVISSAQESAAPAAAQPPAVRSASIELVRKHPLAIRWMHWINFPILFTMILSGLWIYWADSIPYVGHIGEVYRIGWGHHTLVRLFPVGFWNAIHGTFKLPTGLGYHFFFMWIFAINGLIYVVYMAVSGAWREFVPDRHSFGEAWGVTLHDLHIRRGLPPQKKYNGAQKIAYSVVVLMGAGSLVTGFAIYKPTTLHWITALMGGYEMARWLHFWLTIGFCIFFVIHVVQVALAGWNNFRAMITGYEIAPRAKIAEEER